MTTLDASSGALPEQTSPLGKGEPREARISRRRLAGFALLRERPGLTAALIFTGLLLVASIHPALLAPADPLEASARDAFLPPSLEYPLGTDENGRDVLSRLIHGARSSLFLGLGATALGLGLGIPLGLIAGLGHRFVGGAVMRFVDVLLAFPDLLLALVVISFWGEGLINSLLAIGIASVPRYARMVHAQSQVVRRSAYVEAARTLGLHPLQLIGKHVLPNSIKPVILLATIGIGGKIAAGASLSFLGFGAPPPTPEWGSMIAMGRHYLGNAWWLTAFPGIFITLTVVSLTALGREWMRRSEGRTS